MTIFAGVYSRDPDVPLPEQLKREIGFAISRRDEYSVTRYDNANFFVASVDVGAFGQSGISIDGQEGACVVAGDPILRDGSERLNKDRSADVSQIFDCLRRGDVSILGGASGTFAGVFFDARKNELSVFTDKIGVRQVFVYVCPEYIIFSTALRILEAITSVPKRLSLKGVIEEVELHWPTGRRTPYADIEVLSQASILRAKAATLRTDVYWYWPEPEARRMSLEEHLDSCHRAFVAALKVRLGDDDETLSFLSGGLDSRSIVAGLRQLGTRVHAINFAPPGSQDRVFAAMFSERIRSNFLQMPYSLDVLDMVQAGPAVRKFVEQKSQAEEISLDRPRCVWSGHGGSVGLGHVYLTEQIVNSTVQGEYQNAIKLYRDNREDQLPRRPLTRAVFEQYQNWPTTALLMELENTISNQRERQFYHFLMNNDQRRSMQPCFEDCDLHGLEYLMPYFDSELLSAISIVPIDQCLYHRFYNKWLSFFDDSVQQTPWQSYPGHEPSFVAPPENLGYQFDGSYSKRWIELRREARLNKAEEILGSGTDITEVLSKPVIAAAKLFCKLGSDRLGYAVDKGYKYYRYLHVSSDVVFD